MTGIRLCSLGVVPLAIVGVAALGVSSTITPALPTGVKTVRAEAKLLDTEGFVGFVSGGSGTPIISQELLSEVVARFNPTSPNFPGQPLFPVIGAVHPLFTPEGFYAGLGTKQLPQNISIAEGVQIEDNLVMNQIAEGNNVLIGGGSQSATIPSLLMDELLALPAVEQPTTSQLAFVLEVDPNAPNGGVLERFNVPGDPLNFPSIGIDFSGATPADTPWDTAIYDAEYDGFSDFPQYPIDPLSDINAAFGIVYVHSQTADVPFSQLAETVRLPVSADYTGHTEYFMIPTPDLPLLDPLRGSPVGNAIADLLQPDLKVLVNLGYGSITEGWSQGPANVPTPFGLFPTNINPADVLTALANGAQQGIQAFTSDLSHLSLSGGSDAGSTAAGAGVDTAASSTQTAAASLASFTDIVNAFSSAASQAYSVLLPTADIINAIVISFPAWAATLSVDELTSGNLLDAIGMPIAAFFGLLSVAATLEFGDIDSAATSIVGDFQGLIPF